MNASFFPIGLVIGGGVAYHLGQKAAGGGNVWRVLVVAYGAAFALSCVLWWLAPGGSRPTAPAARAELGAALLIGLAALAIEAGFFLAYRGGWSLGTTSLLSTLAVSTVLTVFGIVALGESFTLSRLGGVVLASFGAFLIMRA